MLCCLGVFPLNKISHHCADDKGRQRPCRCATLFNDIYVKTSQTRCFRNTYLVLFLGFDTFFFFVIKLDCGPALWVILFRIEPRIHRNMKARRTSHKLLDTIHPLYRYGDEPFRMERNARAESNMGARGLLRFQVEITFTFLRWHIT